MKRFKLIIGERGHVVGVALMRRGDNGAVRYGTLGRGGELLHPKRGELVNPSRREVRVQGNIGGRVELMPVDGDRSRAVRVPVYHAFTISTGDEQ